MTESLEKVMERAWAQTNVLVVGEKATTQRGLIRLEEWPEGFVLWFHGEIVWMSWQ